MIPDILLPFGQRRPSSTDLVSQASAIAGIKPKPLPSSIDISRVREDQYGASPINTRLRHTPGTIEHAMNSIRNRYALSEKDERTVKDYLWHRGGKDANIELSTLYRAIELVKERKFEHMRKFNKQTVKASPAGQEYEALLPKGKLEVDLSDYDYKVLGDLKSTGDDVAAGAYAQAAGEIAAPKTEFVKGDSAWLDLAANVTREIPTDVLEYAKRLTDLQVRVEGILNKKPGHVRAIQILQDINDRFEAVSPYIEEASKAKQAAFQMSPQGMDQLKRLQFNQQPLNERVGKLFTQGVLDTGTGVAGMLGAAGVPRMRELGAFFEDESLPQTQIFGDDGGMDWGAAGEQMLRVGGQIFGMIATGGIAGLGKKSTEVGVKGFLQTLKAPANFAVREAIIEGGSTYLDLRNSGKSHEDARLAAGQVFLADAIAGTLLNRFGELAPDKGVVRKMVMGIPSEALEEAQQTVAQNLASGKEWDLGLKDALFVGAIAGGTFGGIHGLTESQREGRSQKKIEHQARSVEMLAEIDFNKRAESTPPVPKVTQKEPPKTKIMAAASGIAEASTVKSPDTGLPRPVEPTPVKPQPVETPEVFHGSRQEFDEFESNDNGIFFTSNKDVAWDYTNKDVFGKSGPPDESRIKSAKLKMSNPLEIDARGKRNDNIPVPWQEWKPKVFGNLPEGSVSVDKVVARAKEMGHDGVIIRNVVDTADPTLKTKSDVYVVFDKDQIIQSDVQKPPASVKQTEEPITDVKPQAKMGNLQVGQVFSLKPDGPKFTVQISPYNLSDKRRTLYYGDSADSKFDSNKHLDFDGDGDMVYLHESGANETPKPAAPDAQLTKESNLPVKKEVFTVQFAGKTYEVGSFEEAADKWDEFRNTSNAGSTQLGEGLEVKNQDGEFVARISYNGRIWKPDGTEIPTHRTERHKKAFETKDTKKALESSEIADNKDDAGNEPKQLGTSSEGSAASGASGSDEGTRSERPTPSVPAGQTEADAPIRSDGNGQGESLSGVGGSGDSVLPASTDDDSSGFHSRDYLIPDTATIGKGGFAAKRDAAVAAVKTLRTIEERGGKATEEEKAILSHFPGWGWTGNLLNAKNALPSSTNFKSYSALRDVLTDEEFEAAKHATINSHYTDPKVIKALWKGVNRLGLDRGRALEPATGIGLIPAIGPDSVSWEQVELDSLSGRIATALHSKSQVHIKSFQDALIKGNYDLAISNVPFANFRVFDPKFQTLTGRPELLGSLHDYFIAKMISETRPGGLIVAITSRYTMDKQDSRVREWYQSQTELLGAIRLPSNAFKENAGTDVVTDILFFRKLNIGEAPTGETFTDLVEQQVGDGSALVNEYFDRYPEMVLGSPSLQGKMHGGKEYTVESNGDLEAQMDKALSQLPKDIYVEGDNRTKDQQRVVAGGGRRSGSIYKREGKTYRNIDGLETAVEGLDTRETQKLDLFLALRDARIAINEGMRTGVDDAGLKQLQKDLKKAYDAYVKKFGPVNKNRNQAPWIDDPDAYGVLAIENWDSKKRTVTGLADIFTKRTVSSDQIVNHANTPTEALFASLNNKGKIDFEEMKRVSKKTEAQLKDDLVGTQIFYDQAKGKFVTRAEFGGGNVIEKLKQSEKAGDEKAVKFLETRRPKRVAVEDIDSCPGSPWIPKELYPKFVAELLSVPEREVSIRYNPFNASYDVAQKNRYGASPGFRGTAATVTYGTSRANALSLIQNMLNGKPARITDKDSDGKETLNEEETNAANAKIAEIRQAWDEWTLSNSERAANLENVYNETVNVYAPTEYDGSFLTLPGMNSDYTDRSHRKNSILRILMNDSTLLAHEVGTGKTATMQGAAMELRRTGLASKPVHVVKNGMLRQYVKEFYNLYPGARLLVISDKAMEPKNRKKTIAQIATGDWDSVIIPYSKFTRITTSPATQLKFYQDIVDEFEKVFEGTDEATVKQAEKSIEKVKNKIKSLKEKINNRSDDAVYWEELGIDALFVDEFHNFKNLFYITKNRVKGLGDPNGSQQAFDMLMKIQHIQKQSGRIVGATGTPISNTVAELHTMLKYLAPDLLKEQNMEVFDAWASTFATITREVEQAITGEFKPSDRYTKFSNVPELLQQWSRVVDTVFTEDVKDKDGKEAITVPYRMDMDGNRTDEPVIIESLPTMALKSVWTDLIDRAKNIKYPVRAGEDNMLSLSTEYRKSVADIRLVNPEAADNPESKINKAANNIIQIYKKFAKTSGTQIVFLDMGVPKKFSAMPKAVVEEGEENMEAESAGRTEYDNFSLYEDLRDKLIKAGVKASEVAFFQEAKSDAARLALQEKVRNGEVRVLIGTTQLMGEGLNVQNKVVALHHMQAGWRPIELIQRNGRGFRQGNENEGVIELHYVMKDSFDVFMWGTNRRKAKFINEIARGDVNGARSIDDISDQSDTLTIEQLEMAASGNPLVGEFFTLEHKLRKLTSLRESFRKRQARLKAEIEGDVTFIIPSIEKEIASLGRVVASITIPKEFEMKVGGKVYDKPKEAGLAIYSAISKAKMFEDQEITVGHYAGLEVKVARYRMQLGKEHYAAILNDPNERVSVTIPLNADALVDAETRDSTAASLGSRIASRADEFQQQLNRAEAKLANIRSEGPKKEAELSKVFKDEDEYQKVQARYSEVRNAIAVSGAQEGTGWGSSVKAIDEDGPVTFGSRKRRLPFRAASEAETERWNLRERTFRRERGPYLRTAIDQAKELGATTAELENAETQWDNSDIIAGRFVWRKLMEKPTIEIDTDERHAMREDLADLYYFNGAANKNRSATLVTGLPGSGKSSVIVNKVVAEQGAMIIDSDDFKVALPEYRDGLGSGAVHEESGRLADMVFDRAITNGDNLVLPILGKTDTKLRKLMQDMKSVGYSVQIVYVHITPEESAQRVIARNIAGSQGFTDPAYSLEIGNLPENAYNKVKSEFDGHARYDNSTRPAILVEEQNVLPGSRGHRGPIDASQIAAATKSRHDLEGSGESSFQPSEPMASDGQGASGSNVQPPGTRGARIQPDPIIGGKAKNLRDIIFDVADAFGVEVNRGRPRTKDWAGEYDARTGKTLIRYSGDLDNTAHELAHNIDDQYGILEKWKARGKRSPFDSELAEFWQFGSIATSGPRAKLIYKRAEGLAEFLRAYVVNPEAAKAAAPNFYNYLLEKIPGKAWDALDSFSIDVRTWAGLPAAQQVAANVRTSRQQKRIGDKLRYSLLGDGYDFQITGLDKLQTRFQDSLKPLMKAVNTAKKIGGVDSLLPNEDPQTLIRTWMGNHSKIDQVFENGMINSKMQLVTPGGLTWILEPLVRQRTVAEFEAIKTKADAWMIAERTIAEAKKIDDIRAENVIRELNGEKPIKNFEKDVDRLTGIGAGIYSDQDVAQRVLDELITDPDIADIQEYASKYRLWSDWLLKYMVDTGRMSEESYVQIKAYDIPYVALHRIFEGMEASIAKIPSKKAAIGKVADPVQKYFGSTREIRDPLESLVMQTAAIIKESDRNRAVRSVVNLLRGDRVLYSGAVENLAQIGYEVKQGEPNAVKVFVDGKAEFWTFQKDVFESIKGIGELDVTNFFDQIARLPAKTLRAFVIYSPGFILRNPIRDTFHRSVVSATGSGVRTVLKKQTKGEFAKFQLSGGDQAGHYWESEDTWEQAISEIEKHTLKGGRSIVSRLGDLGRGYKEVAQWSEVRGRMDEFKSAYEHGIKVLGYDEENAMLYGGSQARDLLDYAIAGTWGRWINRYIPFTNASTQGLARTIRAFRDNPGAATARAAIYVLLPTLAVYLMNLAQGDDHMEEYRDMPDYIRDLFWNIKIAPNLWLRIPKPFEVGVMASGLERAIDKFAGNKHAFEGYIGSALKAVGGPYADETTLYGPFQSIYEIRANRDFFRGKYIVPPYESELMLELRKGTKNSSRLGKWIGSLINADPRNVDHFIQGQFAETGRGAMALSDIGRDDKSKSTAHWLGIGTGLFVESPAYSSKSVQWVLNMEQGIGIRRDDSMLAELIDEYFKAGTDERRNSLAKAMRIRSQAVKEALEGINNGALLKTSWEAVKSRYEEPKAAKSDSLSVVPRIEPRLTMPKL